MNNSAQKINFDFAILKAFLEENADFLTDARFQKIQQPTRQELIFTLRNHGECRKLYVNISPKFFHLCFISEENEKKRVIKIPQSPPMFCMLLRKYLEGAKVAKVFQPDEERILEFYFETYNELSEKIYLCLAIELMGKHSNVVLYNYDTNVIIGCAHNVGSDKSREREVIGGLPYAYPRRGKSQEKFFGLSDLFADQLHYGEPSVNELIDNYFAYLQQEEKLKELNSKLSAFVNNKLKKINSALEKVQKQSQKGEKTDLHRKKGDLIMSNLSGNKDFSKEIEVFDWEENKSIKIELDETKTLKENANNFYKLYNKSKTAYLKSQEMTQSLQSEKEYFEQVLYSLTEAQTIEELLEIQEELGLEQKLGKNKNEPVKKVQKKNITVKNLYYFKVYIGKNNKQNDYIISKIAEENDLWFHTRNCPGSHVLLKVQSGQKPSDEIIFACAKLAKEHSTAKDSSKVGVIYTKKKFLKKPPCAKPGYVTYSGEKEIILD